MSLFSIKLNLLLIIITLLYFKSSDLKPNPLIDEFVWERITNSGSDDAFFALDIQEVLKKYNDWVKYIPRVKPHFAVKCNPNPYVLELMTTLDMGFDCASKVTMNCNI